jgi:hypothetical protein
MGRTAAAAVTLALLAGVGLVMLPGGGGRERFASLAEQSTPSLTALAEELALTVGARRLQGAGACNAGSPPGNGGKGNCTKTLASGTICQPTCAKGYLVSGPTSCLNGVLTSASCTLERKLYASFEGCFDNMAWGKNLVGNAAGVDGFYVASVTSAPKGDNTTLPIVERCAKACHKLKYKRAGIFNGGRCMCANNPATTKKEVLPNGHQRGCKPCSSYKHFLLSGKTKHKYTCGASNLTSVYRADYRNHEWAPPVQQVYTPPPPPSLVSGGKYTLTPKEIKKLYDTLGKHASVAVPLSMCVDRVNSRCSSTNIGGGGDQSIDRDGDGKIQQEELFDVFDHIDNGALTVYDCNGKEYPSRWIGDGYCDNGVKTEDGTPDFNCATFHCDHGDCKAGCKPGPNGRDKQTIQVDGASEGSYGKIKKFGAIWKAKFRAFSGKTYYFTTSNEQAPGALNQTMQKLQVRLLDNAGKQLAGGAAVQAANGQWTAPGKPTTGLGAGAGLKLDVNVEVFVPAAKGVCTTGHVRGAAGPATCYTYITAPQGITWQDAENACKALKGPYGQTVKSNLVSIGRSDEEMFISKTVLGGVGSGSAWIGGRKNAKGLWAWSTGTVWKFINFDKAAVLGKSNTCVAIKHVAAQPPNVKQSDKWLAPDCTIKLQGYVCKQETGLKLEGATGAFKLFVQTKPPPVAVPPPVWKTALFHRHGGNLSAHNISKFVPRYRASDAACANKLDLKQQNNTFCDAMIKDGFTCAVYFCEDKAKCQYSGFCDKSCHFGKCVTAANPRPPPPPPPPRSGLVPPRAKSCDPRTNTACCINSYEVQQSTPGASNTSSGSDCPTLVANGFTCKAFLCPTCPYAGFCDKFCKFCSTKITYTGQVG